MDNSILDKLAQMQVNALVTDNRGFNALNLPFYMRAPAASLNTNALNEGSISNASWIDFNPIARSALDSLREISGVAPSKRLVDSLGRLQSPVLRPQGSFEWADWLAGTAAEGLQTALSAADLAGLAGAIGPQAGKRLMNALMDQSGQVDVWHGSPQKQLAASASPVVQSAEKVGGGAVIKGFKDKQIPVNEATNDFYAYRGAKEFSEEGDRGIYFSTDPWLAKAYADLYHGTVQRIKLNKSKLIDLRGLKTGDPDEVAKRLKKYGITEEEFPSINVNGKDVLTFSEESDRILYIANKHGYDGFIGMEAGKPNVLLTPNANKKYFKNSEIADDADAYVGGEWDSGDIPTNSIGSRESGGAVEALMKTRK